MITHFDDLKNSVLGISSDRNLICFLHGYIMNVRVSKMKKSELASIFSDLQFMLRFAYEHGTLDRGV